VGGQTKTIQKINQDYENIDWGKLRNKCGLKKYIIRNEWNNEVIYPVKDIENSFIMLAGAEYGLRSFDGGITYQFHYGNDIVATKNYDLISAIDGKVVDIGYGNYIGNYLVLANKKYKILYGHLAKIEVQKWQEIKQGELIAIQGNTGYITYNDGIKKHVPYHLHFELWVYNQDKMRWESFNLFENSIHKNYIYKYVYEDKI
jgi:murein DD-endopeptidase MepM/ murein hydrolase activator NlpD